MTTAHPSPERRWLLIQVHRARIAYILRSGRRAVASEVAERMNAIARLCDCGRTPQGRALAERLARLEPNSEPFVTELLAGRAVERVV